MSRFAFFPRRTSNGKQMEVKDDFALHPLPSFCVVATHGIKHQAKPGRTRSISHTRFQQHLGSCQFPVLPIRFFVFIPLLFLFTRSAAQKQKLCSTVKVTRVTASESCTPFRWHFGPFFAFATCLEVTASVMLKLCWIV